MAYSKKITGLLSALFSWFFASTQPTQFSLATDASFLRSFKEGQRYWALGQTIRVNFHFTMKDGIYSWLTYYTDGRFSNLLTADAKSSATTPQQILYENKAALGMKQISVGWTHYLRGNFKSEGRWNAYAFAGFGLLFGKVTNIQSPIPDTSVYLVPVFVGEGHFKRLTFDLGLGIEFPVGGDIFIYVEGRALVPTTDYPSPYLFVNDNAPFTAAANVGMRILFH